MNLWTQLESKKITDRETIQQHLIKKLGQPKTETHHNLLSELTKKINSYYTEPEEQNHTIYSLIGSVTEIQAKKYKEGKNKGQTYYALKLNTKETLQARKETLPEAKWTQITQSAILGQDLVFKYRKWITNKQLLDFCPQAKTN